VLPKVRLNLGLLGKKLIILQSVIRIEGINLIQLAGDDVKDLISASRKVCYNLALKNSRTCDVWELIGKMALLPELVVDLQSSSTRGAAQMALAMSLARAPTLNINEATASISEGSDPNKLLDTCGGYDTQIVRHIHHNEFYDKVIRLEDKAIEVELLKKMESKKKPVRSDGESEYTWTSSKEAEKNKAKTGDDAYCSPAPDAEK
jgi:hypothetical protein